jgi:ATP-dependent RNA helicase RhlE
MTTFRELNLTKPLLRALEDMSISEPTPIQLKAFPVIMSGRDAVGIAQTGTGKTLSYLLPILRMLDYSEQRPPRVVIVVPTRELVVQVVQEIEKLSKYMSLRVFGVYGASNINTQKARLFEGLDILVGTPGRLIDLTLSNSLQFKSIKKLVIDEADEMLNLGFRPQLMQLLEAMPLKRQSLLFSATMSEEVELLINRYFLSPETLEIIARGTPADKITQLAYFVPNFYTKLNLLKRLLEDQHDWTKVLLFVNNKTRAGELETMLESTGVEIGVMHSNKSQTNRFAAIKQFQEGSLRVLIATDVMARGLDLQGITHVINFDIPTVPDTYVHRIGRTGRAGQTGVAIALVSDFDKAQFKAIEKQLGTKITPVLLPADLEINNELITEELPVRRDKNLAKNKKLQFSGGGAFHEKKDKNKKVQLGGKRRQEKQKRALELSKSKRKR